MFKRLVLTLSLVLAVVLGVQAAEVIKSKVNPQTGKLDLVHGPGTASALGVLQPDGTSITVTSGGVISAPTGGSGNVTGPASSVVGSIPRWSNTAGTGLSAGLSIGTLTDGYLCTYSSSAAGFICNTSPSGLGMTYPGAGIPNSTGSAWGTSYTVGTSASNIVQLNGSAQLPAVSGALLTNLPAGSLSGTIPSAVLGNSSVYIGSTAVALNRGTGSLALTGISSIDGTAANLSGTPALPDGTTATTQSKNDSSTKLATTAFVLAQTNTDTAAGIVATGSGQVNKVWKTDASGVPGWRDDSTGGTPTFDTVGTGTNVSATMTVGAGGTLTYSSTGIVNASRFQGVTSVDATEFGYLDGVTSAIQTQIDGKAATNASTTGSAGSLKSPLTTGVAQLSGMTAGTTRVKTVRDANDTVLELGGSYTPTGTWNWASATATWPTFNQNTTGTAAGITGSQTQNYVYAAPNGSSGTALFRALVAGDLPASITSNTSGTAATLSNGDKGDFTVSSGIATIDSGAVTLAKMANMATASLLGRNTAGTGAPEVLSASTARSLLGLGTVYQYNVGTGANNIPKLAASPGTPDGTKFLRDDGTWVTPSGSGDITSVGDCLTGACLNEGSSGGTYVGLYSASGAVRLRNNAGVVEARTASDAGYANFRAGTITADSLSINKVSGTAGDVAMVEANSTDTDSAGFRGPDSITSNTSYRIKLPNARVTSDKMVLAATNAAESGTGTPTDPYVQTGSWIDLDNYAALAGATFTGKVSTPAATSGGNGFNIGQGSACASSGTNGDLCITSSGLYATYGGATYGPFITTAGATNFNAVGTGTNTTATMTVGAGASMVPTSTGIIEATRVYAAADTPATKYITFTGVSAARAKTVRDAADTILELGGSYTPTGTWTNMILATPNLGTPSALTLTNATGLPVSGITSSTSTALGVGSVELGHASDTTLTRSSAGVLAVEGTTVSMNSTSATHTASTIELGAASDTTLARSSAGVITVEGVTVTRSMYSGSVSFNPSSVSSGACSAAVDGGTATGVATTDVIDWGFSADPTSTTGYDPSGNLGYIVAYPTADHVNFKFCNKSGSAIDPGSVTLNWKVRR